jgi:N-acetylmuramoyl-L-alanine amidase
LWLKFINTEKNVYIPQNHLHPLMTSLIPKMIRSFIFDVALLCGVLCFVIPFSGSAQTSLDRISAVERSDGKGYVIRYHLTELADSFRVIQPSTDMIQMMLYSDDIDTTGLSLPPVSDIFPALEVHKTDLGVGVNVHLGEGNFFKTTVYPDQNQRHLLLALERTTPDEIRRITDGVEPIVWNIDKTRESVPGLDNSTDEESDNSFLRLRNSENFTTIVLDAGHGGKDPGTSNRQLGLLEKDVVLAVTLKVGEYIKQYMPEVNVLYTRTDDTFVPLPERGLVATRNKADLFVSIHANSAPSAPTAYGTETFFLGLARSESALEVMKRENSVVQFENGGAGLNLSEEELLIYELSNSGNMAISERIATMVEGQFKNRAGRRSRGVKQAGLEALWHASTPAVLIELGFLSNPNEARYLTSEYGQAILASAIFRAIRDFKNEYDRSLRNGNTVQNTSRASNE